MIPNKKPNSQLISNRDAPITFFYDRVQVPILFPSIHQHQLTILHIGDVRALDSTIPTKDLQQLHSINSYYFILLLIHFNQLIVKLIISRAEFPLSCDCPLLS